jgi:hypothetical protein
MNKLMSCQEAAWYVSSSRRHQWNFRISRLPLGATALACCASIDAFFFSAETLGEERRPTKRLPSLHRVNQRAQAVDG